MATYSHGITVSWNSVPFQEVSDLSWSYGGALPKGRDTTWTDDIGTVNITCMGTANISTTRYGERQTLTISGGGATLTHKAIFESLGVAAELNGVTRYTVTLKLVDDVTWP